jgi:hypothetical protein
MHIIDFGSKGRRKPSILWTLFRIWRVWRHYPSLRLGQFLECAAVTLHDPALFYLRDEDLVAKLDKFRHEHPVRPRSL